ncbi:alpha/beta hydrolase [Amycolatopsis jiangsuensis]|uniref:Acetyl esterase/lipase n=1 Tax=Amycolatopsis jiangsuensis TaxID=1181879 RepID=A0A840IUA8_9PSEU|nr:alpha/beta hydrolase [Amycolatopsis jiangsuensis]MBB4686056.1 acetyl esterase/lipase [Amycolatopsis jiangsuensis]
MHTTVIGPEFPPPAGLSAKAIDSLRNPRPKIRFPALDDYAGWQELVANWEREAKGRLARMDNGLSAGAEECYLDGVHTYLSRAPGAGDGGPVQLFFHGGALSFGAGEACRVSGALATTSSGITSYAVDYRMPPEHPFPAALDDAITAYRRLLAEHDPCDIVVGGGSAGGNIAAALLVRAREEGLPMPAAAVLLTPVVDLTESGDTHRTLAAVDELQSLAAVNLLYAAGRPLEDPCLSPLFADLSHFPPTYLQSGTRDTLLSGTVRMHRKLRAAGVPAELHVGEAMPHGGFGGAPEDRELDAELRRFIAEHTRR